MTDARQFPSMLTKVFESPEESIRIVREFERKLAGSQGARYAVGTNSCTSGILISLLAIGVKEGDEVIVPSLTWGSTWSPVALIEAKLVPVDCSDSFPAMDAQMVKKAISRNTKAIITVGLWGNPAGIAEIQRISKEKSIPLIVDAAQLFNSKVSNKGIGSIGDLEVMSFNSTKIPMALGEGGAVVCNSKEYYERLLLLTQHPARISFELDNLSFHEFNDGLSFNFKINPLAAFIGIQRLNESPLPEIRLFSEKVKGVIKQYSISELLPPESWVKTKTSGTHLLIDAGMLPESQQLNLLKDFRQIGVNARHCCYETISGICDKRKGRLFPWTEKRLRISKETFPNSEKWKEKLIIISMPK